MKYIPVYQEGVNSEEWHDVSKELPFLDKKLGADFLVVYRGESGFMAIMRYYDEKWWQGTHGEGIDWRDSGFLTHWRELPNWPGVRNFGQNAGK